ncbi:MAG: hypothetical protein ACOC0D_06660 [Spirochaeta sp.]
MGGLAVWLLPWLAALGALVAMGLNYTVEVERVKQEDEFEQDFTDDFDA